MVKKVLLALSLAFVSMKVQVAGAETLTATTMFQDVTGHWAENVIVELTENQVIVSDGTDSFRPDEPITRAELLSMILRAKEIQPVKQSHTVFANLPKEDWATPYAETAYRLGLVEGEKSQGRLVLKPDETIQKQELISLILQANGESGKINQLLWSTTMKTLNNFKDQEQISVQYQRPFVYALQKKMFYPSEDRQLQPRKTVTRAEAAQYVLNHIVKPRSSYKEWQTEMESVPLTYKKIIQVQTTAYNEHVLSYLGLPLRYGIVAVDPKVIPLGTHLYIEGYGYAVAADIGSKVKNNHVDVFLPSLEAAIAYGRQKDTKVYILD